MLGNAKLKQRQDGPVIYAIAFHFLAGMVTGSAFAVGTLILLLGFVLLEGAVLTFVQGATAGLAVLASLVAVEMGYVAGVLARGVLEQAGLVARPHGPNPHVS